MKKLLALTLVGSLISTVSCGTTTASNSDLKSTKTSVYDTTVTKDNANYVPSTYSTNRVAYYDGLYNTYEYGQNYMSDIGLEYDAYSDSDLNTNTSYSTSYTDQRDSTSANYMTNPYMYSNDLYSNDIYTDLGETDFNNGLITYEHNTDNVDISPLGTNVLNATTTRLDTTTDDNIVNREDDSTMNKVTYEMGNTYDEVKNATKEIVNDVSKDAKKMVRDVKNDVKKASNNMTY